MFNNTPAQNRLSGVKQMHVFVQLTLTFIFKETTEECVGEKQHPTNKYKYINISQTINYVTFKISHHLFILCINRKNTKTHCLVSIY